MLPALVPDGRQLGAVEVRDGGRVAAAGAGWRHRGRSLCSAFGAKRCALEGWHITAIQHLGRWASTQVLEYVEEAYAEVPGTGQVAGAPLLQSEEDLAPLPALHDRLKAVEEQQALISEKLPDEVKQSVQTVPHLPSNGQGSSFWH